jgi:hypothetical protein
VQIPFFFANAASFRGDTTAPAGKRAPVDRPRTQKHLLVLAAHDLLWHKDFIPLQSYRRIEVIQE